MLHRAPLHLSAAALLLILSAAGCAQEAVEQDSSTTTQDQAICERAQAKLTTCFGQAAQSAMSCDANAAREVLGQSCEELEQTSQGKGDLICNPFLWWTWSACGSSSSTSRARSFWVSVNQCNDDFCDGVYGGQTCALVTLEDQSGQEVARAYTNTNSNARFTDVELEPGEYVVRLWRRDGQPGQMMTSSRGSLSLNERVQAVRPLVVERDAELKRVTFYVDRAESQLLRGCASLRGQVSSTCRGESAMSPELTEWSWLVRVQGRNAAGELTSLTRPLKTMDTNTFWINGLMPGDYTLSFLEMEIPSFERRNNPDYARLASRYATGRTLEQPLLVSPEDVPNELNLEPQTLDHTRCR